MIRASFVRWLRRFSLLRLRFSGLALLFCLSVLLPVLVSSSSYSATQPHRAAGAEQADADTTAVLDQAKTLYQTGQFEAAIVIWQQLADAYAAADDSLNQAVALSNLSLTHQALGQWAEATDAIFNSLELLALAPESSEQQRILGQTLDIQGQLQRRTGQLEAALETWQQAGNIYQVLGNEADVTRSQINQAQVLQDLGLNPRACRTVLTALGSESSTCQISTEQLQAIASRPADALTILGLRGLGNILRIIGSPQQASDVLQLALEKAQAIDNAYELTQIYLSIGNLNRTQANNLLLEPNQQSELQNLGLTAYQSAAEIAATSLLRFQADLNQLSLLIQVERYTAALEIWQSLTAQQQKLPHGRDGIYALVNLAQSGIELLSVTRSVTVSEVDDILVSALQQADAIDDLRARAYTLGIQGRLYEQVDDFDRAEDSTRQALNITSSYGDQDITYQFAWQLGRIHEFQGNREEAIASYSQAYSVLQTLRSDLVAVGSEVQFSFRESVEPIYRQFVTLLLEAEDREPSQANLVQAREVIESLQLAELDNFFQEACTTVSPVQIDQVDPNAAVLYSIILSGRLDIILSQPGQPLRHRKIEVSQSELTAQIDQLRRAIAFDALPSRSRGNAARAVTIEPLDDALALVPEASRDFLSPARQLYDWLIDWTIPFLNETTETLVFVLDGELRNIPMAVLHDGDEYLIEQYGIALTPGLQLLESTPIVLDNLRTLAAGLSEARQNFPPLPNVSREVAEIEAEVPSEILLNESFTKSNFRTAVDAAPFSIVHVATHGEFSSQLENTFVLTWDDRLNANELDNLLRAAPRQQEPVELLVLSACQTAVGDRRAALGLAGIAVRAGARSTMASLWLVNDEATAVLMAQLYGELSTRGATKAEALRRAQLALLNDNQFTHPYFWSAFVLVGSWL